MSFKFVTILTCLLSISFSYASALSIEKTSRSYSDVLIQASTSHGLEDMRATTLIDNEDFEHFIEQAMKTPYLVPKFCENFKSVENGLLWSKPESFIKENCKIKLVNILKQFTSGQYIVRTIFYAGVNKDGQDFEKMIFLAENSITLNSFLVEFDILID